MTEHRDEDRIARYLEGDLTTAEATALEAEAAASPGLAKRIAAERALFDALAPPTPSDDSNAFVASVHRRVAAREAPGPRRRGRPIAGVALAAAALLSAGLASRMMRGPTEPEPVARGTSSASESKWMGIAAYRLAGGDPTRLGDVMNADDELLIAYSNLGPAPARYLLVFAVDAAGSVHWYHPAWTDPDDNPVSIRIERGAGDVHLNEAVAHDLSPGRMTLHGVFLDAPMSVREAERRIEAGTLGAEARAEHSVGVNVR